MADFKLASFYEAAQAQEFSRDFQFHIVTLGPLTEQDRLYFTTATLPGLSNNVQQVPYMGHTFNVPGTVKYEGNSNWRVHFRCDEGQNIREKLIAWEKEIFSFEASGGKYGVPVEKATVELTGKDITTTTRKFNLVGIFPTNIGDIQYDVTGGGKIQEFDVTFAYQYWEEV